MDKLRTIETKNSEQLTKTVAKGGGIVFAGNIVERVIRFLLEILLGRVLGARGYGLYSLGYGFIRLGSRMSMLGLQNGLVRFASLYSGIGDKGRVKGTLVSAFVISILSSLAVGGSLFLLASRISQAFDMPEFDAVLRIFVSAFPFYVIMMMTAYSARAFKLMKYDAAIRSIFHPILNIAIVSVSFLLGARLSGAVGGFSISSAFSAFFGLLLLKRIFPDFTSELKPIYEIRKILRFSFPVLFIGFSYVILTQANRIMLGYFKASGDVGIYSAAANIALQSGIILQSFTPISAPIISDLYNRNETKELERLFKTVTRWIISLTLPIILILTLFSKQILAIIGQEFTSGWLVLVILCSAEFVATSVGPVGFILQMSGKQDIEFANTVAMLVLNIGLNIWLIKVYGILGAAIATGLSMIAINTIKIIEVYKIIGIQPYERRYYKPLVAGAAATFLSVFLSMLRLPNSLWLLNLLMFLFTYPAVLYLLRLEDEDRMVLKNVAGKLRLR